MDNIDLFFDLIDENRERYDLFWRHQQDLDKETLKVWASKRLIVSEEIKNDWDSRERLFTLAVKDLQEWLRRRA